HAEDGIRVDLVTGVQTCALPICQPGYGATPAHSVEIDPDSVLARALGRTTVDVNSYHHQAADEVGRGLRAVAWSPDGLIEAVEADRKSTRLNSSHQIISYAVFCL